LGSRKFLFIKMGPVISYTIDLSGIGALRGQRYILTARGEITVQWISIGETNCIINWTEIMDSTDDKGQFKSRTWPASTARTFFFTD